MWTRLLCLTVLALGVCETARADSGTTRHLLAGVHAFKDGRYEEALVELRVVARAPDAPADLAFYLGPTLYKLTRYREALGVFVTSAMTRDELTELYLGQTYYQLSLYRKARAVFVGLRARGVGPVIGEAATRYIEAVDAAYQARPDAVVIDAYVDQARELAPTDPVVAGEIYDEARAVEALAAAHHRHDEIVAALGATWNAAGRARAVVDALSTEPALAPEGSWELARAYRAIGDPGRARPLLEAIAKGAGPHAREAAGMLALPAP